MNVFDRIKSLADKQGISVTKVALDLGFSENLFYQWKKSYPKSDRLEKVADYFNVSVDYLLGREEKQPEPYYALTDKEKNDIAIQAEKLMEGIENGENLNFYGEPATKDQKDRLLLAIKTAMEMNKQEAKMKYTPKKYRK